MKVLVIGSGGREHALVWKLAKSSQVSDICALPGNAGIGNTARRVAGNVKDTDAIVEFAARQSFDLTIVGPETPLIAGLTDAMEEKGLKVFGPRKEAAQLEGSKSFAKTLMLENGIPTGYCEVFTDAAKAKAYVTYTAERSSDPIVIKADGEAAGKGVFVCKTKEEAIKAVEDILEKRIFGQSGQRLLVEEYLSGPEATILCFVAGDKYVMMPPSQDHKRAYDNDEGPNTGGMGAYSPVPVVTPELLKEVEDTIIVPTLSGLSKRGIKYQGVLYFGLALTPTGPKVIEYNCRFGDPETQVILPLLSGDLAEIALSIANGGLDEKLVNWYNKKTMCVVMAAGGYPGDYAKGKVIEGLDSIEDPDVCVFHAGTEHHGHNICTAGGRVLGVTAVAEDYARCREKAYAAVAKIHFEGAHFRNDIGAKLI